MEGEGGGGSRPSIEQGVQARQQQNKGNHCSFLYTFNEGPPYTFRHPVSCLCDP